MTLTVGELKKRLEPLDNKLCVKVVSGNWLNESGISIFDTKNPDDGIDFIECRSIEG